MRTVAQQFSQYMDQIAATAEMVSLSFEMGGQSLARFRSSHEVAEAARQIHANAQRAGSTAFAYDGAYLAACAEFEYAIRTIIERYIDRIMTAISDYHHVPKVIRDWHPYGCAYILMNINQESFRHLTPEVILANLSSCERASSRVPYRLTPEAFSYTQRNMSPQIIEELFRDRVDIEKVWQKVSRENSMQTHLGTENCSMAEKLCKDKLTQFISSRNNRIHRGSSYYSASYTEINTCVEFYKTLVSCVAEIMERNLNSL